MCVVLSVFNLKLLNLVKMWGFWKFKNNNVKDVKEWKLLYLFIFKECIYVMNIKYKIVGENVVMLFSFFV